MQPRCASEYLAFHPLEFIARSVRPHIFLPCRCATSLQGRDFKLGTYLEKNSELFEYDPKKNLVSLKKGGGGGGTK